MLCLGIPDSLEASDTERLRYGYGMVKVWIWYGYSMGRKTGVG